MRLPLDRDAASFDLALTALFEFAAKESKADGGRPARIEVTDASLQQALATALAGTETSVVIVDDLPAVRQMLRGLEIAQRGDVYPALLDTTGVSVQRVRAFADAAARFYDARPWQHLTNEDLMVVEAPAPPKGMTCLSVLGDGGEQFGLAFFESRRAFERVLDLADARHMRRAFGVTFGSAADFPFADVDLWEDHALAVSGPLAYPLAADIRRDGITRPTARRLTHMEALLRALADTTEDDLDAGRWQRQVTTFDGPIELTLTLPLLLEAERGDRRAVQRRAFAPKLAERASVQVAKFLEQREFASMREINQALAEANDDGLFEQPLDVVAGRPLTALEQAQELAYDALDATGRLRIKLARKALSLSPDCVDAHIVLGEAAPTPEAALEWYRRGVEAGERTIGETRFAAEAGEFWGHLDTRPYMRARLALAGTLRALSRHEEGLEHYRELLRLNSSDNQGVRYLLLRALLERGHDQEAGALLERYPDDAQAMWPYARALWVFRQEGDSARARVVLREAIRVNPQVATFLLDPDSLPWANAPYFQLGSKEDAAYAADVLYDSFAQTPGALPWVSAHTPTGNTRRRRRKTHYRP